MVSILTAAIAASLGVMIYLAVPVVAMTAHVETRKRIGQFYLKLAARALKQFTFVRRVLSGYDVLPIHVDNEQKLLKVTLSSPLVGDDSEYRFADPDNRILRLFNKPVALAYENVPAAIDAELAEIGAAAQDKHNDEAFWEGDPLEKPDEVVVDTTVPLTDSLRLIDPVDFFGIVNNSVDPENIKTAEQKTKKRFEKYSGNISAEDVVATVFGFFAGAGGVLLIRYVNDKLLDGGGGGGGGGIAIPMNPGMLDVTPVVDLVVMSL